MRRVWVWVGVLITSACTDRWMTWSDVWVGGWVEKGVGEALYRSFNQPLVLPGLPRTCLLPACLLPALTGGLSSVAEWVRCGQCNKVLGGRRSLKQHIACVHAPASPGHQCKYCLKVYKNKHTLFSHVSQYHRYSGGTATPHPPPNAAQ